MPWTYLLLHLKCHYLKNHSEISAIYKAARFNEVWYFIKFNSFIYILNETITWLAPCFSSLLLPSFQRDHGCTYVSDFVFPWVTCVVLSSLRREMNAASVWHVALHLAVNVELTQVCQGVLGSEWTAVYSLAPLLIRNEAVLLLQLWQAMVVTVSTFNTLCAYRALFAASLDSLGEPSFQLCPRLWPLLHHVSPRDTVNPTKDLLIQVA